jgi:hypothetical protein
VPPSAPTTAIEEVNEQKPIEVTVAMPTISIWTAAEQGDVSTLTQYIQRHPHPADLLNKRDPVSECTLLHLAIVSSHSSDTFATLECLLRHGANPSARNIDNVQALHTIPLHHGHNGDKTLACMRLVLDHNDGNTQCRDGDGWTPLHYAARFIPTDPWPVMQLLLAHGADLMAKEYSTQRTPLFALFANGDHVHVLHEIYTTSSLALWQQCAEFIDPNTRRSYHASLVLQAVKYRRMNILQWLVTTVPVLDALVDVVTPQELSLATHLCSHDMLPCLQTLAALVAAKRAKKPATIEPLVTRLFRFLSRHKKHIQEGERIAV